MKILVVNAGSSSLKYQLISMTKENVLAKGACERIGLEGSQLKHVCGDKEVIINEKMPDHKTAVKLVLKALVDKEHGAIKDMSEIQAVGHRVVHSAEDYKKSVLIDNEVIKTCEKNAELAPLHVPANLTGINACREVMPKTKMAAVFDTAFHSTIKDYAYLYAIPYEDYQNFKVRRYGFHGTSHKYVSEEAAKFLKTPIEELKIVTCHLGNGSSVTAVDGGKSVDTTMGFTPLEGVPMGTRSGDIDPAALEFLAQKKNMTLSEIINYLNKKSGVLGVSGISSDFRDLHKAAAEGNERAQLALNIFNYRVRKYIGSYAVAMGGLDVIVFTAGIGENTPAVRSEIIKDLKFLGAELDKKLNEKPNDGKTRLISKKDCKVKVLVVPTNEELVIARETKNLL